MDFENRWYNEAGSTVDCRISYGGSQPYKCTGQDYTVTTGLAAGSYYPGRTSTLLQTSTVYSDAAYGTYNLLVNHQYVYSGTPYGAGSTQTMYFTVS